jgi:hypothetical protein
MLDTLIGKGIVLTASRGPALNARGSCGDGAKRQHSQVATGARRSHSGRAVTSTPLSRRASGPYPFAFFSRYKAPAILSRAQLANIEM